jgi:chitin disaccharide deacetylase
MMDEISNKYLIINADDFGSNKSTNSAISELFEKKMITSSSMFTVTDYSKEAAAITAENKFPVGVHFTINSDDNEERWQGNSNAKSFSDEKGLMLNSIKLSLKAKSKDVTNELEAQYSYMLNNGCKPDHADNHCGTLYGINGRMFFINAFRFCKKYELPFRFPNKGDYLNRQYAGKAPQVLLLAHRIIANIAKYYKIMMLDDMISNPFPIREIKSYEDLRDYYINELRNIGPGITELFLHPSYPKDDKPSEKDNEWLKREYELKLLLSGDLLEVAREKSIVLVSWGNAPFVKANK